MEHTLLFGNCLKTLVRLTKNLRASFLREHFVVAYFSTGVNCVNMLSIVFLKHFRECALVVSVKKASEILMQEQVLVFTLFWFPKLLNTL